MKQEKSQLSTHVKYISLLVLAHQEHAKCLLRKVYTDYDIINDIGKLFLTPNSPIIFLNLPTLENSLIFPPKNLTSWF